jgi:hypothetical protein
MVQVSKPAVSPISKSHRTRQVPYALKQLKHASSPITLSSAASCTASADCQDGVERGRNENAFPGGIRLWETKRNSRELKWRVL